MADSYGAPQDKGQEEMQKPPPYTEAADMSSAPTSTEYPTQAPPPAGYLEQPPPTTGYPMQSPPSAGYPVQPPPPAGYPVQSPPPVGYPVQPPPPAGYVQPQVADPSNVVIVSQPGVVVHHSISFRDTPVVCACPNCHNQVTSNVRREIGGLTLLVMGALCIFGLWFFCCLIPLCVNACKDAVHTCPVCKHQLGRWNQL